MVTVPGSCWAGALDGVWAQAAVVASRVARRMFVFMRYPGWKPRILGAEREQQPGVLIAQGFHHITLHAAVGGAAQPVR